MEMTPFEALYGYKAPKLLSYIPGTTQIAEVDATLKQKDQILSLLKENLEQAQNCIKCMDDQKWMERDFELGEWVFLRLQPYRQSSMELKRSMKLTPCCFGPEKILQHIRKVAYKLDLPVDSQIHHIFHFSQLNKKLGEGRKHSLNKISIEW